MSTTAIDSPVAPNAYRLLWAGFMAIFAAGVGFAIRGGIFDNWQELFGFSSAQTGLINGAGFTSFCFGIIIGGMVVDKIGYGKLVLVAFMLHVVSAIVSLAAAPGMSNQGAFNLLFIGTFLFGLANGTLEAVANPLVATLFPNDRTHYLNILHASWPLGLIAGGVLGWILDDRMHIDARFQLAIFLVPTVIYGLMFFGQSYPQSEASQKGLGLGEMFRDVGILGSAVVGLMIGLFVKDGLGPLFQGLTANDFFVSTNWAYLSIGVGIVAWLGFSGLSGWSMGAGLLFVLFLTHILVGAVELGTDSWIQNIEGNLLTPEQGKILFVFTSLTMFVLRFCAHFIETKLGLSPVAILLVCAILACIGLNLVSGITSFGGALLALTVYGVGKTFFWPTMLAVASDRFPRTGAIAISIMGGLGMMSAGLIGSAGLGYSKDRFTAKELQANAPAVYDSFKGDKESSFLIFEKVLPVDGKKLGDLTSRLNAERTKIDKEGGDRDTAIGNVLSEDEQKVYEASVTGDRKTLVADSFIPATMAVIYLVLLVYFISIGGYKRVHVESN